MVFTLLSVSCWAQFIEFAITDDGQQVYLTTTLAFRGAPSEEPPRWRIYRFDRQVLEEFAEGGEVLDGPPGTAAQPGAASIQVSGNGHSVAFVLTKICPATETCELGAQAEIRGERSRVLPPGTQRVFLSRSGEWALLASTPFIVLNGAGLTLPLRDTASTLVNLATGLQSTIGFPATIAGTFALASNGSVLVADLDRASGARAPRVGIWKSGDFSPLPDADGPIALLGLSDDARTVLATRTGPFVLGETPIADIPSPPTELIAIDVIQGNVRTVAELPPNGSYIPLGISNDGSRVLLATIGPEGSSPITLVDTRTGVLTGFDLPDREVAINGTLSGDGQIVILSTNKGRILRARAGPVGQPAAFEELLPPTPFIDFAGQLAPGALMKIRRPVGGAMDWKDRIRLDGLPLAILSEDAMTITAQAPWGIEAPRADLSIDYPAGSPLTQRSAVAVSDSAPLLPRPQLISADFTGEFRAIPRDGDIVHLFMTGLGLVQGVIQTGERAPLTELRPLRRPLHCRFRPYQEDTQMLFAGLAPGLLGVYQLTFRFGAEAAPQVHPSAILCGFEASGFDFGFLLPQNSVLRPIR